MSLPVNPLTRIDVLVHKGYRRVQQYAFKNADGTAHDLSPYTANDGLTSTLVDKRTDTAVFTKTTGSGIVVDDAANGLATLTWTASNTALLDVGEDFYGYDWHGDDGGAAGLKALMTFSRVVVLRSSQGS